MAFALCHILRAHFILLHGPFRNHGFVSSFGSGQLGPIAFCQGIRCLDTKATVTPWSHKVQVVCFRMLDFETSKSNSEVSKSNCVKITSYLKTALLQSIPEGAVSQNVIINLSPFLVTKIRFCAS